MHIYLNIYAHTYTLTQVHIKRYAYDGCCPLIDFLWLVCNVEDWVGTVATWRWGRWEPEGCRCWRIANASHCGRGWASPGRWSGRVPLAARIGGSWRGLRNPRRKPIRCQMKFVPPAAPGGSTLGTSQTRSQNSIYMGRILSFWLNDTHFTQHNFNRGHSYLRSREDGGFPINEKVF